MAQQLKIIDGDGHIFEDGDAIARHFPTVRRVPDSGAACFRSIAISNIR